MSLRSSTEDKNAQGKDSSHLLGMTVAVISNAFDVLRVNSVRDLSLILFSRETWWRGNCGLHRAEFRSANKTR